MNIRTNSADFKNSPMSRRLFLTSVTLAPFAGTVGQASASEHLEPGELQSMIDRFEHLNHLKAELGARIDRLWDSVDRPQKLGVKLSEICDDEMIYPPEHRSMKFFTIGALEKHFKQTAFRLPMFEKMEAQRQSDLRKARSILGEEKSRCDAWEEASGYQALDREYDLLFDQICTLEEAICKFECRSFGDIIAKVAFVRDWLWEGGVEWSFQHEAVLGSMFGVVPSSSPASSRKA